MTLETFREVSLYLLWVATLSNILAMIVTWNLGRRTRKIMWKVIAEAETHIFQKLEPLKMRELKITLSPEILKQLLKVGKVEMFSRDETLILELEPMSEPDKLRIIAEAVG